MFTIRQNGDEWELLDAAGAVLSSHATYDIALGELSVLLHAHLASLAIVEAEGDADSIDNGLLPDVWFSELCFSEVTPDGRDFSGVTWTSRDPNVSTLPLMLQTETDYGHFGAQLAGYFTEINLSASPTGRGRFYDSDCGEQLRDMLLDGRRFGVSVDPGAVEGEFVCTETDDDGWCIDGFVRFDSYEIIGVTATPFPAFAAAYVTVEADAVAASAASVADVEPVVEASSDGEPARVAAAGRVAVRERSLLTHPPAEWFPMTPEGPGLLMPTPLTITREGHVLGHLAAWGTCHVGNDRVCVTPPTSRLAYRRFLTGEVLCADGTRRPTGALTWGIPHADLNASLLMAQAHYADSRHGWADVLTGEDEFGIWVSGGIRPGIDDDDLRILRALALSGDWRYDREARDLELIAGLAVNVPGFPIPRVVTASGRSIDQPTMRAGVGAGMRQMALVASGIVLPEQYAQLTRSTPCGCSESDDADTAFRAQVLAALSKLDRRTAHLTGPAIDHVRDRLGLAVERELPPGSYVPRAR